MEIRGKEQGTMRRMEEVRVTSEGCVVQGKFDQRKGWVKRAVVVTRDTQRA